MKRNDNIHGFILKHCETIEEVNGEALVFEHEKTGAKLIYISNDDDNKVFNIGFRTPSPNSTGVAHILEHSVLCGSRKYPVKEPFVELVKGSLNTFLNAMTYPDKTVYPVASTNAKDFMNLMDVYLDAVFYPNIYQIPYIFYQEGWHYHLEKAEDPITYNGVVYNEMKGVYSSPEEILQGEIFKALYPSTIYGQESGGHPDCIPALSYDAFLAFHKKYYHPSNSYIYLYGDGDVEEHLAYLNDHYLADFDRETVDSQIQTEPAFEKMAEKTASYPVSGEDDLTHKDYLSLSWVFEDHASFEDHLAYDLLGHILMGSNASPLKKALLDLNICQDVDYSFTSSLKQPMFSIMLKNTDETYKDLVIDTINRTLEKLAEDGLDQRSIDAAININEFSLIEADYGTYPKGLMLGLEMFDSWLYDEDPLKHLKFKSAISHLREDAANHGFEKRIQTCFLENTHKAFVSIHPDPDLAERKNQELEKKLADYKASLDAAALQDLIQETQTLLERQNSEDTAEALATIPKLALSEIGKQARLYPIEVETYKNRTLLWHPGHTGGVVYFRLYFDTHVISQEDLKYLSLLNKIIGRVRTEDYTSELLNQETEIYTGGISSSIETYDNTKEEGAYESKFVFKGKVKAENLSKLTELTHSMLLRTCFDEKQLIRDIISEVKMSKENQFVMSGNAVAAQRLQSYYSQSARLFDEIGGIRFYQFVADLYDHFDEKFEQLAAKLHETAQALFNRSNVILSITCDTELKDAALIAADSIMDALPASEQAVYSYAFDLKPGNEGFMTAAEIQYVCQGYNLRKLGYAYHGSLLVLKTIMSMDYLWNQIRVLGGAYGAGLSITRAGEFVFSTFRDPNLKRTLDVYDQAASYIRHLKLSQRELEKYIIGTISGRDVPLSAALSANSADSMYFSRLTQEDIQKEREEILGTTEEKLKAMADMVAEAMNQRMLCVIGSEDAVRKAEDVFTSIQYIK